METYPSHNSPTTFTDEPVGRCTLLCESVIVAVTGLKLGEIPCPRCDARKLLYFIVGHYRHLWDGTDDSGKLVAPGVYLCQVSVELDEAQGDQIKPLHVAY